MANVNNEVTEYLLDCEKKALRQIKHNNIVKCYDILQEKDFCYIVMEECKEGTLKDYIQSKGNYSKLKS